MYKLLYKERPIIGARLKNMRLLEFMETIVQDNMEDIIELSSLETDAAEVLESKEEKGGDIPSDKKEEKEGREEGVEKESKKEEEERAEREEEKWESNSSDDSYDPAKDPAGRGSSSDEEEEHLSLPRRNIHRLHPCLQPRRGNPLPLFQSLHHRYLLHQHRQQLPSQKMEIASGPIIRVRGACSEMLFQWERLVAAS